MAPGGVPAESGFDSFLNFLENPSFIATNLRVNEQGVCTIANFPFQKYGAVQVIATNLSASVGEVYPIQDLQKGLLLRDLRLVSNLQKNEPYCEKRSSILLNKKQKTEMKSDCQNLIIDNLPQFFELQKVLVITKKGSDRENDVGYRFWDFLKNWNTLSVEEKLKKYDKFACHELNIFLRFKDPKFFKEVVQMFLASKIEKVKLKKFLKI